jgi:hypothetical protein
MGSSQSHTFYWMHQTPILVLVYFLISRRERLLTDHQVVWRWLADPDAQLIVWPLVFSLM